MVGGLREVGALPLARHAGVAEGPSVAWLEPSYIACCKPTGVHLLACSMACTGLHNLHACALCSEQEGGPGFAPGYSVAARVTAAPSWRICVRHRVIVCCCGTAVGVVRQWLVLLQGPFKPGKQLPLGRQACRKGGSARGAGPLANPGSAGLISWQLVRFLLPRRVLPWTSPHAAPLTC